MDKKALSKLSNFLCKQIRQKNIQGKPSNFTSVVEAKRHSVGPARQGDFFLTNFQTFFYEQIRQNSTKWYAHMPNSKLPTNFQFNISIFEAKVSLQTLL